MQHIKHDVGIPSKIEQTLNLKVSQVPVISDHAKGGSPGTNLKYVILEEDNEFFVFDVIAMFTNIPIECAVELSLKDGTINQAPFSFA